MAGEASLIAVLSVCLLGAIGIFLALLNYGILIAFMGAALGGSLLAAATAVWIASRDVKRRPDRTKQVKPTSPSPGPVETRY